MADKTAIEWTDATWNPVVGCSKVSEGCRNCYAMSVAHRNAAMGSERYSGLTEKRPSGVEWNGTVRTVSQALDQPLRWKRPRRIFVNSMSDLFHPDVSPFFIDRVFAVMETAEQHTFQILTKRPEVMLKYISLYDEHIRNTGYPQGFAGRFPHVWLGVSVENQKTADERIPLLLQVPAAVRWLSMEPLLGPVNLSQFLRSYSIGSPGAAPTWRSIDWVVVGGESGHRARPLHPHWVRSLRDQCKDARVPFLFKQWGEWKPINPQSSEDWCTNIEGPIAIMDSMGYRWEDEPMMPTADVINSCWELQKLGKKAAGRILDGRTWDEYPEPINAHPATPASATAK